MRKLVLILSLCIPLGIHAQSKVGINVTPAEFTLDVRSSAEIDSPALFLGTPAKGHFLRWYAGRDGDPSPYLLFGLADTFRIASGGPDHADFSTRMTILPNGYTGINPLLSGDVVDPFMVFSDLVTDLPQPDAFSPPGSTFYAIDNTLSAAQRFTVDASGFLTEIEVYVRSLGPGMAKCNYILRETDQNGIMLDAGSIEFTNTSFAYTTIYLYPVPVVAGQALFLELTYDSDAFSEWNANDTNPLPNGEAWSNDGMYQTNGTDDMAFTTQVNVSDTNRVQSISVLGGSARVKLGDIIFPRELGTLHQVLQIGYNGQLEWGDQSGGVFANLAGTVYNTGDHNTDDFVFGDNHLISMFTNLMFFDKDMGAFRVGRTTNDDWQPIHIGQFSFATGWNTRASGYCSLATGHLTSASGQYASANGFKSVTSGDYAFSAGNTTIAGGANSMAFGNKTIASGSASGAVGDFNIAGGDYAFATGQMTNASGNMSLTAGLETNASAPMTAAFGNATIANGYASTVIGMYNDPIEEFPQYQFAYDTPLFIIGNGETNNDRINAFVVRKNGRVGMGTNDPVTNMHIRGVSEVGIKLESTSDDAALSLQHGNDTWDFLLNHDESNSLLWKYNDSTKMTLTHDGRVAIGSPDMATGYHLSVDGKIIAEEVRCQLKMDWPDYVFANDYPLMPLDQVERAIKINGHLPGIPAAAIINEQGVDLAEMQVKMMEKIEELTLYILQLNERIAELENSQKY